MPCPRGSLTPSHPCPPSSSLLGLTRALLPCSSADRSLALPPPFDLHGWRPRPGYVPGCNTPLLRPCSHLPVPLLPTAQAGKAAQSLTGLLLPSASPGVSVTTARAGTSTAPLPRPCWPLQQDWCPWSPQGCLCPDGLRAFPAQVPSPAACCPPGPTQLPGSCTRRLQGEPPTQPWAPVSPALGLSPEPLGLTPPLLPSARRTGLLLPNSCPLCALTAAPTVLQFLLLGPQAEPWLLPVTSALARVHLSPCPVSSGLSPPCLRLSASPAAAFSATRPDPRLLQDARPASCQVPRAAPPQQGHQGPGCSPGCFSQMSRLATACPRPHSCGHSCCCPHAL